MSDSLIIKRCQELLTEEEYPYKRSKQIHVRHSKLGVRGPCFQNGYYALEDVSAVYDHVKCHQDDLANEAAAGLEIRLKRSLCECAATSPIYYTNQIDKKLLPAPFYLAAPSNGILRNRNNLREDIRREIELANSFAPDNWQQSVTHYERAAEYCEALDNALSERKDVLKANAQTAVLISGLLTMVTAAAALFGGLLPI